MTTLTDAERAALTEADFEVLPKDWMRAIDDYASAYNDFVMSGGKQNARELREAYDAARNRYEDWLALLIKRLTSPAAMPEQGLGTVVANGDSLREAGDTNRPDTVTDAPVSPSPAPDTAALLAAYDEANASKDPTHDFERGVPIRRARLADISHDLAAALRAEQEKREKAERVAQAIAEDCEAEEQENARLSRKYDDLVESVIGALRLDEDDALDARANPMPCLPVMVNERANEVLRLQQRVATLEALATRVAYEIETGVQETWPKGQVPAYVERARDLLIASDPRSLSQLRDAVCALDQSVAALRAEQERFNRADTAAKEPVHRSSPRSR